jgi:hypothetical protein
MKSIVFFDHISIPVPTEAIYRRLGYRRRSTKVSDQQKEDVDRSIESVLSHIFLKGAAVRMPVKIFEAFRIDLDGAVFESADLAKMLAGCEEAVIMAATAGSEVMEVIARNCTDEHLTEGIVADAVASEMVDAALDWIVAYLNRLLVREGRRLTRKRFSAGYGDFSLDNQKIIYELLDLTRIDVAITEHHILVPEKSVTAVAGVWRVINK